MNIAVIGATGGTGIEFVKQALSRGHCITVLARSPEKLIVTDPNLRVVKGDVYNLDAVTQTVRGQEAIFIALGTGEHAIKSSIRTDGTQQVVNALKASGETPLVVILSSLGANESVQQIPFYWRWIVNRMVGDALVDHSAQETVVRTSSLPHIILKPTYMNDEPATGRILATTVPAKVGVRAVIPRADVAAFALDTIKQQEIGHSAVTLTGSK